MTSYELGEVILVTFPHTGTAGKTKRPALVILDIGDADIVLAPITTRERTGAGDWQLQSWSKAGLLRPSWVRLAKIACLNKRAISRRLGRLAAEDSLEVAQRWNSLYRMEREGP